MRAELRHPTPPSARWGRRRIGLEELDEVGFAVLTPDANHRHARARGRGLRPRPRPRGRGWG
jgi:hypothetical protein